MDIWRYYDVTHALHVVCNPLAVERLDELDLVGEQRLIDHVELFGPPIRDDADSRNFVLCPGGEYDRSPCGTGTSAKLAVLHASAIHDALSRLRPDDAGAFAANFDALASDLRQLDARLVDAVAKRHVCRIVYDSFFEKRNIFMMPPHWCAPMPSGTTTSSSSGARR